MGRCLFVVRLVFLLRDEGIVPESRLCFGILELSFRKFLDLLEVSLIGFSFPFFGFFDSLSGLYLVRAGASYIQSSALNLQRLEALKRAMDWKDGGAVCC